MKKIGLLCLALVIALGGLGIGYASWSDTLYIDGTVNTGTVDIVIEDLSGTWVWKVDHDTVQHHGWGTTSGGPDNGPDLPLADVIASATAEMDADDLDGDTVIVTFDNLYPCKWFMVDILVHYPGSIPVRLNVDIINVDDLLVDLLVDGAIGVEAYEWLGDGPNGMECIGEPIINFCGYQLHECDWILLKIWIHVPQDDYYMGKSGGFEVEIDAIQWNLYGNNED